MYALINAQIHGAQRVLLDHAVIVANGRIASIVPTSSLAADLPTHDLQGAHLSAGFIDAQLNGCGGVLLNNAITEATLRHMQQTNLKSGTTSYLPTLITSPDADMQTAVKVAQADMAKHPYEVLGLHLEGPYTNTKRKGIHPEQYIRELSDEMLAFLCANATAIAMVTLAPECNTPQAIQQLRQAGIIVSAGHTAATYDQAMASFDAGVNFATHLYNAMTPTVNGREPGVVGAVYDSQSVCAGVIVDGHHVHYANVRTAYRLLGERFVLVTDATPAANAPAGMDHFNFCGATVYIKDGQCVDANGTLGGSALTMMEGVKNLVIHAGLSLSEALRTATLHPAKALGVDRDLGSIEVGKVANLTVFTDDFHVKACIVNGSYCPQ